MALQAVHNNPGKGERTAARIRDVALDHFSRLGFERATLAEIARSAGVSQPSLHYYFAEGDLRNGLLDGLDTKRCPLHLLTGEYDLSATPALTAELAKLVNATSFQVMEGLGHFPMSENPQQFRRYLLPVLDRIAG